jgi:iron complex transport system substrate-binding protein
MMKTTLYLIIGVVAAVVVVGVTAYVVMDDNDDSSDDGTSTSMDIGSYITVYGNANNDLYINEDDITQLQAIIDSESGWDKGANPYADANQDGVIDSNDIDYVRSMINYEEMEVYYEDYYGDVTAVKFPLSGVNIAVTYYQQAEACAILGVLDDVKVVSKAASVYGSMWPTLADEVEWGTTGSSAITDDAVEKFVANDVKLVVCTPRTENHDLAEQLYDEQGISFIQLWYNGEYCIPTIMTMGFLMDKMAMAEAYVYYCNDTIEELTSKITDKNAKTALVISGYDSENDSISILANDRHGTYVLINKYLANCYTESGTNQFGFVYHNVEWLISNNSDFDYIVFAMSGNSGYADDQSTGTYYTQDSYNQKFETAVSYFSTTDAYKNGNIIGSEYPNTFGYSAYALLPIIAAQMYPDLFDLDDAFDHLQEWFDTYNVVDIDVRESGPITYTGTGYTVSYPQLETA